MFFTHDKRFIIKTMFQEEVDIFILNCHKYFNHIENGKSFLARIYGIFQVKMIGIEPIYFQMMANTIKSKQNIGLKTYDLKGSLVGRYTVPDEKQTLKDKNLLFAKINRVLRKTKGMLQFKNTSSSNDINHIRSQIKRDSEFLMGLGFMDYSILLAIEKVKPPAHNRTNSNSSGFYL